MEREFSGGDGAGMMDGGRGKEAAGAPGADPGAGPATPRKPPAGAGVFRDPVEVFSGVLISGALCAFIKSERALVLADLHMGFEAVAAADGACFPRRQKPLIVKRLERALAIFRPELVVIAGDFKHNFGRSSAQEWREVEEVLNFLDSRADVALVRGNHDNYLQSIISPRPLPLQMEVGGVLVLHGHKEVTALERWCGPKILAHEHPSLRLRDRVGAQVGAPAFLVDRASATLVLPALSPLAPGADVARGPITSPVLRAMDVGRMEAFAADRGELLGFGPLSSLRELEC
ncbi:MAG: metallophosphoesterase [Thermoplasmata archaeon]